MKTPINNLFVMDAQNRSKGNRISDKINKIIKKLGYNYEFKRKVDPFSDMNTLEQRINFYHLLSSVLMQNIEGDIVELGCYNGQCAMLFQKILDVHHSKKVLHLYDSFEVKFSSPGDVKEELLNNFKSNNLRLPEIHQGLFDATLPTELPDVVSFAHIDCGFGGDPLEHKKVMLYCLKQLYNKLQTGAICILMDYHDATTNDPGIDCNPGVKLACDEFLSDKSEQVYCLYGGEVSHAYFVKQ